MKKIANVFVHGPITPERIALSITQHRTKMDIGGHDIFLGQVRADKVNGKLVKSIDFTAYEDMANKAVHAIRQEAFARFNLKCAHILHSLGRIGTGNICLFLFTSSAHRNDCLQATRFIIDEIKTNVPIFGKEIFEDGTHQWKENT